MPINIVAMDPGPSTLDLADTRLNIPVPAVLDAEGRFFLERVDGSVGESINATSCFMNAILGLHQLALQNCQEVTSPATFRFNQYEDVEIKFEQARSSTTFIRIYMVAALYTVLRSLIIFGFYSSTWIILVEKPNGFERVGKIVMINHRRSRPDSFVATTNTTQVTTRAVDITDVTHYNTTFNLSMLPIETPTLTSELPVSNYRYKLYYQFSETSVRITDYLVTIAYGIFRFAQRDAGAVITQTTQEDEDVSRTQIHLLVTEYAPPRRTEPPFFYSYYAATALKDLAKVAVAKRKFNTVEAVVEMGQGIPVGFLNISKLPDTVLNHI